jgi:hypothetical protein
LSVVLSTLILADALNLRQILTLKTVKNVALKYPNKDGITFEDTAMAICMVESDCGRINFGDKQLLKKGLKRASYGVMQVQLQTAKFVIKHYNLMERLLSDVELIEKMMKDSAFNAKISVLYIVWLSEHSKSYFEMVSRYNGGKVNHPYYNKVKKQKAFLSKEHL